MKAERAGEGRVITGDAVLAELGDVLDRNAAVVPMIRRLFDGPPIARVAELASAVGTSRRTLHKRFRVLGLPSPRHWVALARVLRAAGMLASRPACRGKVVARACGIPGPLVMSSQMLRVLGVRPTDAKSIDWRLLLRDWIKGQRSFARTGAVPCCPHCHGPLTRKPA